jgi:hypothetical protein
MINFSTDLSNSLNPVSCTYSKHFNIKVNHNGVLYKKLFYSIESIKISNANVIGTLETMANFTEIKNSRVKKINVEGCVYIHDCLEIDKVRASGDIYIYNCAKINSISGKNIYVVRLPQEIDTCEYGQFNAKERFYRFNLSEFGISDTHRLENCNISALKLDEEIKKVELYGDNKIEKIIFNNKKYSSSEYKVIVKKGSTFKGEVIGGELIFEQSEPM